MDFLKIENSNSLKFDVLDLENINELDEQENFKDECFREKIEIKNTLANHYLTEEEAEKIIIVRLRKKKNIPLSNRFEKAHEKEKIEFSNQLIDIRKKLAHKLGLKKETDVDILGCSGKNIFIAPKDIAKKYQNLFFDDTGMIAQYGGLIFSNCKNEAKVAKNIKIKITNCESKNSKYIAEAKNYENNDGTAKISKSLAEKLGIRENLISQFRMPLNVNGFNILAKGTTRVSDRLTKNAPDIDTSLAEGVDLVVDKSCLKGRRKNQTALNVERQNDIWIFSPQTKEEWQGKYKEDDHQIKRLEQIKDLENFQIFQGNNCQINENNIKIKNPTEQQLNILEQVFGDPENQKTFGEDRYLPLGSYTIDSATCAIREEGKKRDYGLSWQITALMNKESIENDILPKLKEEAKNIVENIKNPTKLKELIIKKRDRGEDSLNSTEEIFSLDYIQEENENILDILREDEENLLINHPKVHSKISEILKEKWKDLAVNGNAKKGMLQGAMIQPYETKKGTIIAPEFEDGTEVIVGRYPVGNIESLTILTVDNKQLKKDENGKMVSTIPEDIASSTGAVFVNPIDASKSSSDYDGDNFFMIKRDVLPNFYKQLKNLGELKQEVNKAKKIPYENNLWKSAVLATDSDIGSSANMLGKIMTSIYEIKDKELLKQIVNYIDNPKNKINKENQKIIESKINENLILVNEPERELIEKKMRSKSVSDKEKKKLIYENNIRLGLKKLIAKGLFYLPEIMQINVDAAKSSNRPENNPIYKNFLKDFATLKEELEKLCPTLTERYSNDLYDENQKAKMTIPSCRTHPISKLAEEINKNFNSIDITAIESKYYNDLLSIAEDKEVVGKKINTFIDNLYNRYKINNNQIFNKKGISDKERRERFNEKLASYRLEIEEFLSSQDYSYEEKEKAKKNLAFALWQKETTLSTSSKINKDFKALSEMSLELGFGYEKTNDSFKFKGDLKPTKDTEILEVPYHLLTTEIEDFNIFEIFNKENIEVEKTLDPNRPIVLIGIDKKHKDIDRINSIIDELLERQKTQIRTETKYICKLNQENIKQTKNFNLSNTEKKLEMKLIKQELKGKLLNNIKNNYVKKEENGRTFLYPKDNLDKTKNNLQEYELKKINEKYYIQHIEAKISGKKVNFIREGTKGYLEIFNKDTEKNEKVKVIVTAMEEEKAIKLDGINNIKYFQKKGKWTEEEQRKYKNAVALKKGQGNRTQYAMIDLPANIKSNIGLKENLRGKGLTMNLFPTIIKDAVKDYSYKDKNIIIQSLKNNDFGTATKEDLESLIKNNTKNGLLELESIARTKGYNKGIGAIGVNGKIIGNINNNVLPIPPGSKIKIKTVEIKTSKEGNFYLSAELNDVILPEIDNEITNVNQKNVKSRMNNRETIVSQANVKTDNIKNETANVKGESISYQTNKKRLNKIPGSLMNQIKANKQRLNKIPDSLMNQIKANKMKLAKLSESSKNIDSELNI